MKGKFLKRIISVALVSTMLAACIPQAFAITTNTTESVEKNTDITDLPDENYELGAVVVSLTFNAPSVEWLLRDFEIESTRLLTPGSHTQNVYYVTFAEKTDEIIWEAIDVLNESSYVEVAEPNFYYSVGLEPDEPYSNPNIEPTQQTTKPILTPDKATEPLEKNTEPDEAYELGAVIVSLTFNAPSVEWLLQDFEIESSRLLTPGSHTQNVYYVTFTEKTDEIIWEAIDVLNESSYVKAAEPNFYYYVEIDPEDPDENLTTQPTSSPEKSIIKGDADGDGKLTIGDVTYIQKYLAGLISEQEINCSAANVSETGKVSIDDSTAIQKRLVGIEIDW